MTGRTNAVAKTRAHQVRWSSWCRSRTTRAGPAAGARCATAGGKGRTIELRLSSASTSCRKPDNYALLWPKKSKNSYQYLILNLLKNSNRQKSSSIISSKSILKFFFFLWIIWTRWFWEIMIIPLFSKSFRKGARVESFYRNAVKFLVVMIKKKKIQSSVMNSLGKKKKKHLELLLIAEEKRDQ